MPPSRTKRGDPAGRQLAGNDGEELLAAAVKGDGAALTRELAAGADPNASLHQGQEGVVDDRGRACFGNGTTGVQIYIPKSLRKIYTPNP